MERDGFTGPKLDQQGKDPESLAASRKVTDVRANALQEIMRGSL